MHSIHIQEQYQQLPTFTNFEDTRLNDCAFLFIHSYCQSLSRIGNHLCIAQIYLATSTSANDTQSYQHDTIKQPTRSTPYIANNIEPCQTLVLLVNMLGHFTFDLAISHSTWILSTMLCPFIFAQTKQTRLLAFELCLYKHLKL